MFAYFQFKFLPMVVALAAFAAAAEDLSLRGHKHRRQAECSSTIGKALSWFQGPAPANGLGYSCPTDIGSGPIVRPTPGNRRLSTKTYLLVVSSLEKKVYKIDPDNHNVIEEWETTDTPYPVDIACVRGTYLVTDLDHDEVDIYNGDKSYRTKVDDGSVTRWISPEDPNDRNYYLTGGGSEVRKYRRTSGVNGGWENVATYTLDFTIAGMVYDLERCSFWVYQFGMSEIHHVKPNGSRLDVVESESFSVPVSNTKGRGLVVIGDSLYLSVIEGGGIHEFSVAGASSFC